MAFGRDGAAARRRAPGNGRSRGGRGQLPRGAVSGAAPERQALGIVRCDEPRPTVARPRQARAGARAAGPGLRLVHRRLRHAGSARGQGAVGGVGSMSAVRNWLEAIGLGQYADAFEANDIDPDLLPRIDDRLLKDIGVSSAGHRLRLRDAIAKLAPTSTAGVNATPALRPSIAPV